MSTTMMPVQRAILIFAIVLCCFRFCLCADCEKFPFHPYCRGMHKRIVNGFLIPYYARPLIDDDLYDCSNGDCKRKIKYLVVLLDDDANNQEDYPYDDYEAPVKKRSRFEQRSRNNLFGMRNKIRDYIN